MSSFSFVCCEISARFNVLYISAGFSFLFGIPLVCFDSKKVTADQKSPEKLFKIGYILFFPCILAFYF